MDDKGGPAVDQGAKRRRGKLEHQGALVIVESPTKARTIKGFLPDGFQVEASIGHVRDLPQSAKEIPEELKGKSWSRLGIDIENNFAPLYVVPQEKKKQIAKLKSLLKKASILYLATDEDREGESISWHLVQVLQPEIPRRRLVFHEITRKAIEESLENPRDVDERLVQAQETRRILDRLYGYEVSPILWRKVGPGLSAGRVQSVAVRLIVNRERERRRFRRASYWDLGARFVTDSGAQFAADLLSYEGRRIASGKDFEVETGKLRASSADSNVLHLTEAAAAELCRELRESRWSIANIEQKPFVDRPLPPFTTSTLQQESNRKLRLPSRRTMQIAQRLYERGFITYMRTDSTVLSEEAIRVCRGRVAQLYGEDYLPAQPRQYRTKVKNAQEAHEAIRPSGEFQRPDELQQVLDEQEFKLYDLIWKRTMACQMSDARGSRTLLQVSDGKAVFQATGKTIEFAGYLRAYVEGADDPEAELADQETVMPAVKVGEAVRAAAVEPRGHTTQPPQRFTEASLIKELENLGIGRPSTYATIIETILRREYVVKSGNALVPSYTAFAVVQLLESHFSHLVDVEFTARMEDDLDAISLGEKESVPYLREFYFGGPDDNGLLKLLRAPIDARASHTLQWEQDAQGRWINVRIGRFGPYLEREEERGAIPMDLAPDELTLEKCEELLHRGMGPVELGVDPVTQKKVYCKSGRFGPYVQLGENDDNPKMKSLLPGMNENSISLEQAQKLLSLPREVGEDPETHEKVFADYGRYGPYVKRGTETRSLARPEDVFEVTLEQAILKLKEEKKSSLMRAPQLLRELGPHPDNQQTVKLLSGRYGPYVSDGATNASLPKGTNPEQMTLQSAVELLRAKAASGKSRPFRRRRKAPGKGKKESASTPRKTKARKKARRKSSSRKAVTKVTEN